MDRNLARKNIRSGLIVDRRLPLHVRHDVRRRRHLRRHEPARRRSVPPAGEEIHLPGASIQPLLLTVGITMALIGVTTTLHPGHRRRRSSSLAMIVVWIRDTRREIEHLPSEHHH